MTGQAAPLEPAHLEQAVLAEFFWVLGLADGHPLRRVLAAAMRPVLRRFVDLVAPFDRAVASEGMPAALRGLAPRFLDKLTVTNAGLIPAAGPLLLLANHPGGFDVFLILSQLPRADIKVIVSEISILRQLPAAGPHFISIGKDAAGRMQAVRAGLRHLKQGGALFVFPGGIVDPDPAFMPGALDGLANWSPSVELFLRQAPQTRVVVAMVGGVLSQGWYHSPVTRLRQERKDRQKVAEVFQSGQQLLFPGSLLLRPEVHFAPPIAAAALRRDAASGAALDGLRAVGRTLLARHWGHTSA